jgi:hypothetical protein
MPIAVLILRNDQARGEPGLPVKSVSQAAFIAQSLPELQPPASQFLVPIGVLDLGLVTFQEIVGRRRQLGTLIVCTHHTPDEVMWAKTLNAGALDCCFDNDGLLSATWAECQTASWGRDRGPCESRPSRWAWLAELRPSARGR